MFIKILKNIKDWLSLKILEKKVNKDIDQNVNMWFNRPIEQIAEHDTDVQQKYYNGITLLKRRVKELGGAEALSKFKGDEDFYVGNDLLALATDEDSQRKSLRQLKESAYVYNGADVKSEKDKEDMIADRIGHYTELQKAKTSRELLRQAREAYNKGDSETHQQLMKDWNRQYGKSRNNSTRH